MIIKYRAEIDGLRALAVIPVIFFHAGFNFFSGGFVGVDVFFVISGYLITTIIIKELNCINGKLFNMCDKSVALKIKKYAMLAGLDYKKYAGHSLRSGFATSTAEHGAEERNIMAMTGHKSTQMVRRYIKEANLFKNNALNKLNIQKLVPK